MIYLIGGPIRTGKSILAKKLLSEKKISNLSTDVIVGLTKDLAHYDPSDPRPNFITKAENFFPHLHEFIRVQQILGIADYCLEGDIILPEQAKQLASEFDIRVCFLGCSQIDFRTIKDNVGSHNWLDELSIKEQQELPERIITTSLYIKNEAEKYDLPFFDLSDDFELRHDEAFKFLISS